MHNNILAFRRFWKNNQRKLHFENTQIKSPAPSLQASPVAIRSAFCIFNVMQQLATLNLCNGKVSLRISGLNCPYKNRRNNVIPAMCSWGNNFLHVHRTINAEIRGVEILSRKTGQRRDMENSSLHQHNIHRLISHGEKQPLMQWDLQTISECACWSEVKIWSSCYIHWHTHKFLSKSETVKQYFFFWILSDLVRLEGRN